MCLISFSALTVPATFPGISEFPVVLSRRYAGGGGKLSDDVYGRLCCARFGEAPRLGLGVTLELLLTGGGGFTVFIDDRLATRFGPDNDAGRGVIAGLILLMRSSEGIEINEHFSLPLVKCCC